METILAFAAAAIGATVWFAIKKAAAEKVIERFGPLVKTTFDVIDPIASDLFGGYESSTFKEAIELAVLRVADGDIDQEDVNAVVAYVASKFDATAAVAKTLKADSETGKATTELAESLKKLTDGAHFAELADVARKGAAILS